MAHVDDALEPGPQDREDVNMAKGRKRKAAEPAARPIEESLRLEWRSPAELAENPKNWKQHPEAQLAALADVIKEVNWAGACLYNEATGRLIDGHARRKVALDQGAEKIPVLVGSWDEETEAKILLTLDPLAAMAQADKSALSTLLATVKTDSPAIAKLLDNLKAQNRIALAAAAEPNPPADTEPAGTEYRQFSVPLTMAQEAFVRDAIRKAKVRACSESSGDALYFLVKEWADAQRS